GGFVAAHYVARRDLTARLVDTRLLLHDRLAGGLDGQITIGRDRDAIGTRELEPDGARISARSYHEIVFELVLVAVVHRVDSRVHGAIPDSRIVRNTGVPLFPLADEVVRGGGHTAFRHDRWSRIGGSQLQFHAAAAHRHQRAVRGECKAGARSARN